MPALRAALTPAIEALVLLAGSSTTQRATTHVIERVIRLPVAVIVLRRATVTVAREDSALACSPRPGRARAGAELADAFLAGRPAGFRAASDATRPVYVRRDVLLFCARYGLKLRDDGRRLAVGFADRAIAAR
jgi:hypothetical protein